MSDNLLSRRAALLKFGMVGAGAYMAPALVNLSVAEARGGKTRKTKPKKTRSCGQGK